MDKKQECYMCKKSHDNKYNYCSTECFNNRKIIYFEKECYICKKIFKYRFYNRENRRIVCSRKCGSIAGSIIAVKKMNEIKIEKRRKNKIENICKICKNIFYTYSHLKSYKKQFCSKRCSCKNNAIIGGIKTKGIPKPQNSGKWVDRFGEKKAKEMKKHLSKIFTEKNAMSDPDVRLKHSQKMKELHSQGKIKYYFKSGKDNISYGIVRYPKLKHDKILGHIVRSAWETEFAYFLKNNSIDYNYESKTFKFDDCTYTPDFFIKEKNLFVEIKGACYDKTMIKIKKFLKHFDVNYMIIGGKSSFNLMKKFDVNTQYINFDDKEKWQGFFL